MSCRILHFSQHYIEVVERGDIFLVAHSLRAPRAHTCKTISSISGGRDCLHTALT